MLGKNDRTNNRLWPVTVKALCNYPFVYQSYWIQYN